jgi:putative DNA primase/helicase
MSATAEVDRMVAAAGGREALARRAQDEAQPPREPFTRVDLAGLLEAPPLPTQFWWDGLVPAGAVTLLGAHGDTGKSMVSLMLACALCAGEPLFGIATRRARVAYFSAEDPARVVLLRLHAIVKGMGQSLADLNDLHVLDATDGDPVLFHEMGKVDGRPGITTAVYGQLRDYLDAHAVDVLIVDNASDVFDASENDRAKVRGFMRALTQLAQPERAVVLLAHVNRGTAAGFSGGADGKAEGYSGSTAWHNSARSRLYLKRDKEGGLVLEHHKNNLGQGRHDPIQLSWPRGGLPQLDKPVEGVVQRIAEHNDAKAILRLIEEFCSRQEWVSTASAGPGTAYQALRDAAGFPPRLQRGEFAELMRTAERRRWIEREDYTNAARKAKQRWILTEEGRKAAGLPARPAPVAPVAPVHVTGAAAGTGKPGAPVAPVRAPGGVGEPTGAQTGAQTEAAPVESAPVQGGAA